MTDDMRARRWQSLPLLLAAVAMLGWGLLHGVPLLRSDLQSQAARQKVDTWARQRQGWTVPEWQAARSSLLAALQTAPRDPVLHVTLAQLYVTQGLLGWDDPAQREAFFGEALDHQRQALALRPTDGYTWAQAAVSLWALGRPAAEVHQAWAQARRYAPREAAVQRALLDLALAGWAEATPDMRGWVRQTWQSASPALRQQYEGDARKWGVADAFESVTQ